MTDARARSGRHITARLDAQAPGVRTTRLLRPRTVSPDHPRLACARPGRSTNPLWPRRVVPRCGWFTVARPVISTPRRRYRVHRNTGPHLVTIAKRPFGKGRDGEW